MNNKRNEIYFLYIQWTPLIQNKLMNYFRSIPSKTACLTNAIFLK